MADGETLIGAASDTAKGIWGRVSKFFWPGTKPEKREYSWDKYDIPRKLMDTVRKNYRDMEPWRVQHADLVKQFVARYGDHGAKNPVPVNKIRQMVKIYMRLLASGTPQAMMEPKYPELKPFAESFKLALNRHLREIDLSNAVSRAVLNAMFSTGVLKTGLADGDEGGQFEIDGVIYDAGKPFSSSIHINNFVIDMEADCFEEVSFIGDRYKRPLAWIEEMKKGDGQRAAETLNESEMSPADRPSGVMEEPDRRLYKEGWCWDIYLPKQQIMCLFADGCDEPIDVVEFDGPERGPYDLIGFDWVPGEVLPSSPASSLEPLHNFINNVINKIGRQADRQKTLGLYSRKNEEDAQSIRDASDGQMVGVTDPQAVKEYKFGGPDPVNHNMAIWADQVYDVHGGGLAVLGGTEAMSKTVGQDQLLNQSANSQVNEMRRVVKAALDKVIMKHAWYLWTDPIREYDVVKEIPGSRISIPVKITPEVREGDFLEYNFSVNPYSMRETTPDETIQMILMLWERMVAPNMQLYMQAGVIPNIVGATQKIFELSNINFGEMFLPVDPNVQLGSNAGMIPMPAQFKRSETVNTRISRPGTTQRGNGQAIMAANAGLAAQNGQSSSASMVG